MHVITKRPFTVAAEKFPSDGKALIAFYKTIRHTDFDTPEELKASFPSLDNFKYRKKWWVFDVGGNNLRIIAFIQFQNKRIYIKHIVTHAEYDKLTRHYSMNKEGA